MLVKKTMLCVAGGISFCIADISGVVTDTSGKIPIAGAVVQLEKGRQSATSGADGRFTFVVSSAVLPSSDNPLASKLSAAISNELLYVNIAQRSAVELTAYNLIGRELSKVCLTLEAGSHSIALPRAGAGIYLYRIKSSVGEFVIKGPTGDAGKGRTPWMQGPMQNITVKRVTAGNPAFNDVISVSKTGYLNFHMEANSPDLSGIQIKMIVCETTVKDADGNVYQAVRIGNQVWTAENLKTTKFNDSTLIPFDSSIYANDDSTSSMAPKFCYYFYTKNADSISKFGAMYNGYAVCTGKLAPKGWHVPTNADWDTLQTYLIAHGYNWDGTTTDNKIAKSLAAKTDWYSGQHQHCMGEIECELEKNNRSGFSALPGGYRDMGGVFYVIGLYGCWWSGTEETAKLEWIRYLTYEKENLLSVIDNKRAFFSIRLVRDEVL